VAAVDDTPRVLHGSWMWARQSEENKAEFVKDHKLGRGRLGETREGEFWPGVTPSTLGWGISRWREGRVRDITVAAQVTLLVAAPACLLCQIVRRRDIRVLVGG